MQIQIRTPSARLGARTSHNVWDVGLDNTSSAPLWRPQEIHTHTHQSTHLLPHLNVQFTPLFDAVSYVTVMSPASHQIILIRLTLLENTHSSHLYTQSQHIPEPLFHQNQHQTRQFHQYVQAGDHPLH